MEGGQVMQCVSECRCCYIRQSYSVALGHSPLWFLEGRDEGEHNTRRTMYQRQHTLVAQLTNDITQLTEIYLV